MKLITRDTDYALRALSFIARHQDRVIPVSELVIELKIPRPFLRKILQVLHAKGVLSSCRGQGGGFRLIRSTDKIFLVDVMKIFQGPLQLNECFLKKVACPKRKVCILRKKISAIEKYVFKELGAITIATLLK